MNDLFILSIKAFVSFCVQFQYTGTRVISLGALRFSANIIVAFVLLFIKKSPKLIETMPLKRSVNKK